MPPHSRNAAADSRAARRGSAPGRVPWMRGSSTHGSSRVGWSSAELYDSRVRTRGDSANATPARTWVGSEPMRRARATATVPVNAAHSRAAIHSRWTTHSGMPALMSTAWKGPLGNR